MRALLVAAIALTAMPACKQASKDSGFSCWFGTVCEDYTTDLPTHEKACKALNAEWEKHACPSEHLVGVCMTEAHQSRMYYGGASNAYTSDAASASCEHELHGTWTSAK